MLSISTNIPVCGSGKTLGLTNGTNNAGLYNGSTGYAFALDIVYGKNVTNAILPPGGIYVTGTLGVTTDSTKSGIVANLSNVNIGKISSMKLGKYILKY